MEKILEGHTIPDNVHLLLEILPKMSVSYFMGYLKEKYSNNKIIEKHSNLKYKRKQENEDKIEDKLTKKEYENPFKGLLK